MCNHQDRRGFFRDVALLAAGTAGATAGGLLPCSATAVEPIKRNGTAKFKLSLAAYSYRRLLSGDSPKMTMEQFVVDCARLGLEGTEPTTYWFPKNLTRQWLVSLKALAFRLGLDISGTAIANDFCHPPGAKRDEQIAHVKKWIEQADVLGAPVIRIFSGHPRGSQSRQQAHRLCVEATEECCQYAGEYGIYLALENHGGLSVPVESMLRIIRDVKSPWFGVNLDTGNFHSKDPYADLAKVAPYAVNVQIKVKIHTPDGKKVPADYKRLARILTQSGYRGYIVLEYEENEDPRKVCPAIIEQLREAFS